MTRFTDADDRIRAGLFAAPLTKTEMAYRQIRQEIIEGVLEANAVIDQEDLAERLGLSTTPIREALRLLESENLVINRRHRNTVVTPIDFDLLEETYAVRRSLDPLAVAFAAVKATDAERELIKNLAVLGHDHDTPLANLHANRRLHRAIYVASGNSALTGILDMLWDRCDRYRMATLGNEDHAQLAHDEHRAIADAVIAGDAERASELMRDHVGESLQRIRAEVTTT